MYFRIDVLAVAVRMTLIKEDCSYKSPSSEILLIIRPSGMALLLNFLQGSDAHNKYQN
jgi:hypothetical protein